MGEKLPKHKVVARAAQKNKITKFKILRGVQSIQQAIIRNIPFFCVISFFRLYK